MFVIVFPRDSGRVQKEAHLVKREYLYVSYDRICWLFDPLWLSEYMYIYRKKSCHIEILISIEHNNFPKTTVLVIFKKATLGILFLLHLLKMQVKVLIE